MKQTHKSQYGTANDNASKITIAAAALLLLVLLIGLFYFLFTGLKERPSDTVISPESDLYVYPDTKAAQQADEWRDTRPQDAEKMDLLASIPTARWFGSDTNFAEVSEYASAAKAKQEIAVMVVYNIPNRDCGLYSAGGAGGTEQYKQYINDYSAAIGDAKAMVIVEPDALAQIDEAGCLDQQQQQQRYDLLRYAIDTFSSLPNTWVYIDAGNSGWITNTQEVADKLKRANVEAADGFALNVSNFHPTDEAVDYGENISDALGGKHFVVDTSRNGLGEYENTVYPDQNWCNPPGRALGNYPTTDTGNDRVDAFLYIKTVGESDGTDPDPNRCFNGPPAGTWWPEYALGLVERWPVDLRQ